MFVIVEKKKTRESEILEKIRRWNYIPSPRCIREAFGVSNTLAKKIVMKRELELGIKRRKAKRLDALQQFLLQRQAIENLKYFLDLKTVKLKDKTECIDI